LLAKTEYASEKSYAVWQEYRKPPHSGYRGTMSEFGT
jgi:hypothetical protein